MVLVKYGIWVDRQTAEGVGLGRIEEMGDT